MFDGLWKEPSQRTFFMFYLPKIAVLGCFWVAALTAFTWTELHQLGDAGVRVYEITGYIFFKIVCGIALVLYIFMLIYAICRACTSTKSMPYLGLRLQFFGLFTFFIILLTAGGILFGFIGPINNNAAEFLSFLSLFNIYLYTLAFVYLPSKSAYYGRRLEIGSIRLEEEDPDHNAFEDNQVINDDGDIELEQLQNREDEESDSSKEEDKKTDQVPLED
eukprot:TRINITY_DN3754_c0_g1_i1.p1 TRINITY_DN3754_c0_g1~~TRINITY_DN3754_c0_g1_i1.p1  ORF type:complete len:219 (-),score=33.79 TRINITY_DN3754_c0_g1_i1:100-756(-)